MQECYVRFTAQSKHKIEPLVMRNLQPHGRVIVDGWLLFTKLIGLDIFQLIYIDGIRLLNCKEIQFLYYMYMRSTKYCE